MNSTLNSSDLEAKMGVTRDKSGHRWRIGNAIAKAMGIGSGQWLSKKQAAMLPDARLGYEKLPPEMKNGTYTEIEILHFAAAAGKFGVVDLSKDYETEQRSLEAKLDAAIAPRDPITGLPPQSAIEAYFRNNDELERKGHSAATYTQFCESSVDHVERYLNNLKLHTNDQVAYVKSKLQIDPEGALSAAVDICYITKHVAALTQKLDTVKQILEIKANSRNFAEYVAAAVPVAAATV